MYTRNTSKEAVYQDSLIELHRSKQNKKSSWSKLFLQETALKPQRPSWGDTQAILNVVSVDQEGKKTTFLCEDFSGIPLVNIQKYMELSLEAFFKVALNLLLSIRNLLQKDYYYENVTAWNILVDFEGWKVKLLPELEGFHEWKTILPSNIVEKKIALDKSNEGAPLTSHDKKMRLLFLQLGVLFYELTLHQKFPVISDIDDVESLDQKCSNEIFQSSVPVGIKNILSKLLMIEKSCYNRTLSLFRDLQKCKKKYMKHHNKTNNTNKNQWPQMAEKCSSFGNQGYWDNWTKSMEKLSYQGDIIEPLRYIMESFLAQRAVLLSLKKEGLWITAEIEKEVIQDNGFLCSTINLPVQLIQYAYSTKQIIIINSEEESRQNFRDPYLQSNPSTSLFILPVVYRNQNLGVLYLENRVMDVFSQIRTNDILALSFPLFLSQSITNPKENIKQPNKAHV